MRKPRRSAARSAWSYSAGRKGKNRVRVFAWPEQGESFWIDYRSDGKRVRQKLWHSDKNRAIREAEEIAAGIGSLDVIARPATAVTLRTLFDMYEREVTPHKGKSARGHDRRTLQLLLTAFGAERRAETLNVRDWQSYIRKRMSGELASEYKRDRKGKVVLVPVRARTVEQDLKLLLAVLNWAERSRDDVHGRYLLERNPLRGLKLPKEESPRRPMFTREQCIALRQAAAKHSPAAERFVMLAWYTGHRSNSIRQLRWSDIDLDAGTIRWRGSNDKIRYEHRNPMHRDLIAFLKQDRARTKAIGDAWLFPMQRKPRTQTGDPASLPMPRDTVMKLWNVLGQAASIPRRQGYGWHSFRRAFAHALRDAPLREQKDLGGWKSERTVVMVYLQPDEQAQRKALDKFPSTA